jgi:glycosyltransferase involved in cell wall biosynthesis
MPAYNCAGFIDESIRSIQAQSYTSWELLIQDDCSTDDTKEIVKRYVCSDPRIKYEKNAANSGAAITRNNALKRAAGRWIAFLDSDDIWLPEKLDSQLKFMKSNNYSFSYTNYAEMDDASEDLGRIVSGPSRITKTGMYCYCWPGCLTVMYDREIVGLLQIADIKKNNVYAMWLKVCNVSDCFLLDRCLAKYRRGRKGSISSHGHLTLIKWHYRLFREAQCMGMLSSALLTCLNLFCGIYKKVKYVSKVDIR